jgi:hypothetical protein
LRAQWESLIALVPSEHRAAAMTHLIAIEHVHAEDAEQSYADGMAGRRRRLDKAADHGRRDPVAVLEPSSPQSVH